MIQFDNKFSLGDKVFAIWGPDIMEFTVLTVVCCADNEEGNFIKYALGNDKVSCTVVPEKEVFKSMSEALTLFKKEVVPTLYEDFARTYDNVPVNLLSDEELQSFHAMMNNGELDALQELRVRGL